MGNILQPGDKLVSDNGCIYKMIRFVAVGRIGETYEVESCGHYYLLQMLFADSSTQEWRQYIQKLIDSGAPSEKFLWPVEIISKGLHFGYVFNQTIPPNYYFWTDLLKRKINPSFETICNVSINICKGMMELHACGYSLLAEYDYYFDPFSGKVLIAICGKIGLFIDNRGHFGVSRFSAPEIVTGYSSAGKNSDRYVLAIYLFYLLMVSHPLEGKIEAAMKCLDLKSQRQLYGSNPIFIFDPNNDENRPLPGYHDNAIKFWNIYPKYIHELFIKCFTEGIRVTQCRPTEREWIKAFQRLRNDIIICPSCGAEVFVETEKGKACWKCKRIVRRIRKTGNKLSQIIDLCPEVLQDRRKLKAYLLDFLPDDRTLRNIICLSFDENIPQEISAIGMIGRKELNFLKKQLMDSYAINEKIAEKVVLLWVEALGCKSDF